ncbi:hypothetical protein Golob_000957 [Gossypium lobatum]|uniref:Diacylglycerol O-acyltransferase n=1 Tax=Gossypium lobatum TaxID=34289 RepID=A0A7J8N9V1_9ROSI|nr:hypothetical protein [Gossypium lobatum]
MELERKNGEWIKSGSCDLGLRRIKVRKESVYEEEEPLSPMARMFQQPESNVYVIAMLGFKNPIDPHFLKANLVHTFLKHPRFFSVQVADEKNGGEVKWVKTKVDLDNHVKIPMVDQHMASPDQFVEDYIANLTNTHISTSIPMWDVHILNLKTCDAESTLVIRVHHSLGDGTSLMSFLISCCRKTSEPDALPSFPAAKKSRPDTGWFWKFWTVLLLALNTLVDIWMCVATTYFLKDTQTPLKAPSRAVAFTSRRIVRRTFCVDDVILVKNATNTKVNDVVLAITQAGLSRYLNRKYGKGMGDGESWENNLPNSVRLTATLFINLRSSPGIYVLTSLAAIAKMVKKHSQNDWGNKIGYVLYPFKIALKDNPLDYIRDAKATMDRKKATLEAQFRLFMAKVFVRFYPTKLATFPLTTMWFSNVAGPQEEISLFGNQVTFIAPSLYGQPVALTIHIISYEKKISMVLSVDDNIIPDPYQLCDDFEEALKLIKKAVVAEGLIKK